MKLAFDKYFKTIESIGFINNKETNILLILAFLRRYIYSSYTNIDDSRIKQIQQIFNCLIRNSCTIQDLPSLYVDSQVYPTTSGSVVTQQNIPVITISDDATVTTQTGTTQKFSDFAYEATLGNEDFLVGYDSTKNVNTRVNAGSLVLTWQPI